MKLYNTEKFIEIAIASHPPDIHLLFMVIMAVVVGFLLDMVEVQHGR